MFEFSMLSANHAFHIAGMMMLSGRVGYPHAFENSKQGTFDSL